MFGRWSPPHGSAPRAEASSQPRPAHGGRLPAVDGLRTFAVFAVIVSHLYEPLARGGGIGVDVFFVISGFVITSLLLRERQGTGRVNYANFYLQRYLRLMPALALCLLVVTVVAMFVGPWATQWHEALIAGFYLTDFYNVAAGTPGISPLFGHTWSLSVEEQFYLVWPLVLVALLLRRRLRVVLTVVAALCVLSLVIRVLMWVPGDVGEARVRIWNSPWTRADQLLVGCLLALAVFHGGERVRKRLRAVATVALVPAGLFLCALVLAVPVTDLSGVGGRLYFSLGFTAVAASAAVVVAVLVLAPDHLLTRVLAWSPFSWTGRTLSYGLYVWHVPVIAIVRELDPPGAAVLALLATVAAAWLSYRFVESPVNRWRSRRGELVARRGAPLPAPATPATGPSPAGRGGFDPRGDEPAGTLPDEQRRASGLRSPR